MSHRVAQLLRELFHRASDFLLRAGGRMTFAAHVLRQLRLVDARHARHARQREDALVVLQKRGSVVHERKLRVHIFASLFKIVIPHRLETSDKILSCLFS